MGISRREYARLRGVSESAVRKAITTGRISVEADGTIDPGRADRQWDERTDPARQRGEHARTLAAATAAGTARAQAARGEVSFLRARLANEVIKAQLAKVRLGKAKGELVDRARAASLVFDLARRERDAWIGWPARVASNMAAELGTDPHRLEVVLDRYLREHLGELAEIRVDLGGGS